ncbi:MAG: pyridoxamine 5'-phosphate oxidase [Alphaproteobacteria bacterium]
MTANEAALPDADDPLALFARWLEDAIRKEQNDANAMALATVDASGLPDVRMVLLKDFGAAGFTFYTNTESAKGLELAANPRAALNFHWKSLRRQVRIRGPVEPVSAAEADAYFATRARDARIGAWASEQSRPMDGMLALQKRVATFAAKFGLGDVPRPPHWSGYRVAPLAVEFWRDRPFRLHERVRYERAAPSEAWRVSRLFP